MALAGVALDRRAQLHQPAQGDRVAALRGQIHDRTVAALYAQEQGIGRPGERTALRVGHARLQQLHGDLWMTANHRRLRGIQPHIAHAFSP